MGGAVFVFFSLSLHCKSVVLTQSVVAGVPSSDILIPIGDWNEQVNAYDGGFE